MKIKLVCVDFELTRAQKTIAALLLACGGVAGISSLAVAAVPHTFAAGQLLKASDLNENFTNLDGRVVALEASKTRISVEGYTAFSTPSGTFTVIPYSNVEYDDLNEFDGSAGTFTPLSDGEYEICASAYGSFPSGAPGFEIDVFVDGTRDNPFVLGHNASGGGPVAVGTGCDVLRLTAGQVVDLRVYQDRTASASFLADGYWDYVRINRL